MADLLTPLPPRERLDRMAYFATYTPERFLEWCKLYAPHAVTAPFGGHHEVIARAFQIEGQTVEVILPREYGKTTIVDLFELYRACYGRDQHVVRFEHDKEIATTKSQLMEQELLSNPRIQADYRIQRGNIWQPANGRLEIAVPDNPYATHAHVFFRALGVLNISRGTTYRFGRIDRAVLNDVVASMREAVSDAWNGFLMTLIKSDLGLAGGGRAKQPISIFMVTTIQAMNDISDRLRKDMTVVTYEYPAILGDAADVKALTEQVSHDMLAIRAMIDQVQGTPETGLTGDAVSDAHFDAYCAQHPVYPTLFARLASSWPSQFSLARHVRDMYRVTPAVWLQEKQHITSDSQFQRFLQAWFLPYHELPPDDGNFLYGMTIDWSGLPKEGNDPKAVFAGAYHRPTGKLYTLGAWCGICTHEDAFEQVYRLFWEWFPWYTGTGVTVFMEDIIAAVGLGFSYFESMRLNKITEAGSGAEAHRYWRKLPFQRFSAKQRGDKLLGILQLRPVCEQRRFYVRPGHSMQDLMVQQFVNFQGTPTHKHLPLAQKLDLCDCVSMFQFKCMPVSVAHVGKTQLARLLSPPAVVSTPSARARWQV